MCLGYACQWCTAGHWAVTGVCPLPWVAGWPEQGGEHRQAGPCECVLHWGGEESVAALDCVGTYRSWKDTQPLRWVLCTVTWMCFSQVLGVASKTVQSKLQERFPLFSPLPHCLSGLFNTWQLPLCDMLCFPGNINVIYGCCPALFREHS